VIAAEVDRIEALLGRPIAAHELEPPNAILVEMGRAVRAVDYLRELEAERRHARALAAWWNGPDAHDLLLTPTLPEPPWVLGLLDPARQDPFTILRGVGERVAFTNAWNDTGHPAISLPLFVDDRGLPIGVQLVAGPGREDVLLRVASQLEAAFPERFSRRPPSMRT
jgi:amidase